MKLTEILLAELDREVERSRWALEQVPEGKYDWKPHEKSMIFGYLADMVATIPYVDRDGDQSRPTRHSAGGGRKNETEAEGDERELVQALDKAAADARAALRKDHRRPPDDAVGNCWLADRLSWSHPATS